MIVRFDEFVNESKKADDNSNEILDSLKQILHDNNAHGIDKNNECKFVMVYSADVSDKIKNLILEWNAIPEVVKGFKMRKSGNEIILSVPFILYGVLN